MAKKLTPGRMVALIIGVCLGVVIALWGVDDFLKSPDPYSWSKTPGIIVRVWTEGNKEHNTLHAEYKYKVDGQSYLASNLRFNDQVFPPQSAEGQPVEVYYQTKNPAIAALDYRKPTKKLYTALVVIGVIAFAIIGGVLAPDPPWMRPNRSARPS